MSQLMKPGERRLTDAQRLHIYGRLRPSRDPSWWQRLLERLGL